MNPGRRGLIRALFGTGIVAALMIGSSIGAAAMIPKAGQQTIREGFILTNLVGYKIPAANYTTGDTFTFSVDIENTRGNSRSQCFELQVFRLTDLQATTAYTEAQLEDMVARGQSANHQVLATTNTKTVNFAPSSQKKTVSFSAVLTAAGYYQFDVGICETGSFAPQPAPAPGSPVSGFVRYLAPAAVAPGGAVGGVTVARLPQAGGGPQLALHLLMLAAGSMLAVSGLLLMRRRSV